MGVEGEFGTGLSSVVVPDVFGNVYLYRTWQTYAHAASCFDIPVTSSRKGAHVALAEHHLQDVRRRGHMRYSGRLTCPNCDYSVTNLPVSNQDTVWFPDHNAPRDALVGAHGFAWSPGWNEASCSLGAYWSTEHRRVPVRPAFVSGAANYREATFQECRCGFYAYYADHHTWCGGPLGAQGIVQVAGKIAIGSKGARVWRARVVALGVPEKKANLPVFQGYVAPEDFVVFGKYTTVTAQEFVERFKRKYPITNLGEMYRNG